MASKSKIRQQAIKSAIRIWELKSIDQLDPLILRLIEVFTELIWENQNAIEDIREGMLHQIAAALTPDSVAAAKPAHAVAKLQPSDSILEIDKRTLFYTDKLSDTATKQGLKTIQFAPVNNQIKLVNAQIEYLLCRRNLYRIGKDGEKDLFAQANAFNQDLNNTVWIGFTSDKEIESLEGIHFYIDFPNTLHRYDLFELLSHTIWHIGDQKIPMATGIREISQPTSQRHGGIFSHYNTLNSSDQEISDLYRKQFLHIAGGVRTASLEKSPFPEDLLLSFPKKVNDLEPQYWIKVTFPPFFKKEDLEDINIHLNAFPVSNKNLKSVTLDRTKSLTGIVTLDVTPGEYFFAVDNVEDSQGRQYNFIPYVSPGQEFGGTYSLKKGGLERFSTKNLSMLVEEMISLFHTELAVFNALKLDNIRNSVNDIEVKINSIKGKLHTNNPGLMEVPTYLIIDSREEDPYVYANYWTTNCESGNGMPYGTILNPLVSVGMERNSCMLIKSSRDGQAIPKNDDMLAAYKLSLTTHGQLLSAMDYENFCRNKYADKIKHVKVRRGIACSNKQKEGLIRTIDVCLVPQEEYKAILNDPVARGELKLELEKRSPYLYNFRVLVEEE